MIKFREKSYGSIYDNVANGDMYAKEGATSGLRGSGTVGKLARGVAAPLSVGGMVADQGRSAITDSLKNAAETAKEYTPTIQNAYVPQKTYSVLQAGKEIATGAGKGLWNYAKKNKGTLTSAATFGAGLAGVGYVANRLQRQKEEVNEGTRSEGLSTGGKVLTGAAALGTGAGLAYKAGKSHDKRLDLAKRVSESNGDLSQFKGKEYKDVASRYVKGANALKDKETGKIPTIAERAKADVDKLTKNKLGVSNKVFKMGRNALIGGTLVAGAGMLANSYLKKSKQSQYSNLEERSYGALGIGKRIGASVYNKAISAAGPNAGLMDKAKALGKGVGAGLSAGGRKLARSTGNFLSPGKGLINDMRKGLESSGEYGKKASEFIGNHKTASTLVGGTVIGGGIFSVANSVGEKSVNALTKLDRKTTDYTKAKEAQQYNYSIGETVHKLAKNAKRQAMENPIAAASFTLMGANSALNIYNSKQAKKSKDKIINSLSSVSPKKTNIIIS